MIKFTKNFYQKGVRKKVISLGLDSGSSMTKAVLFKDEDDSNIDQSKEIFRRTLSRYDK